MSTLTDFPMVVDMLTFFKYAKGLIKTGRDSHTFSINALDHFLSAFPIPVRKHQYSRNVLLQLLHSETLLAHRAVKNTTLVGLE